MSKKVYAYALMITVGMATAMDALATPLGRLFLSPEQRQLLDQQRQSNPVFQPGTQNLPPPLLINGQVHSRNGHRQTWINGVLIDHDPMLARLPVGDRISPATGGRDTLLHGGHLKRYEETRR